MTELTPELTIMVCSICFAVGAFIMAIFIIMVVLCVYCSCDLSDPNMIVPDSDDDE